jgi:uncharacterized protein
MECPRCGVQMEVQVVGLEGAPAAGSPYRISAVPGRARGREIDRCLSCRGVWFDAGEMAAGLREIAPPDLDLRVFLRRVPASEQFAEEGEVLGCPRCEPAGWMDCIRSRAVPGVVFDRCKRCRGVWFDGGELRHFAHPIAAALALALEEFL